MYPAAARPPAFAPVTFEDGFGQRRHALSVAHEPLEVLAFRDDLTSVSSFEFALRDRVGRFSNFQSEHFARIRAVERLGKGGATLALISDQVQGNRLSEILAQAETRRLPIETHAALCLIRQLVSAVAQLHKKPELWHGAIAPERIIVTPNARVVIVEHVLGAAIEQLHYPYEQYWKELRVPMPKTGTGPQFDRRTDVTQVGAVALALLIGRPIALDEYPSRLSEMTAGTWALSANGSMEPLPVPLREWLSRALQLDPRNPFPSALETWAEFDRVLHYSDPLGEVAALEAFLTKYQTSVGVELPKVPVASTSSPAARPVPVPRPQPVSPPPATSSSASHAAATSTSSPTSTTPASAPPSPTVWSPAAPSPAASSPAAPSPISVAAPPRPAAPKAAETASSQPPRIVPQAAPEPPFTPPISSMDEEEEEQESIDNEQEEAESAMSKSTGFPRGRMIAAAIVLIALTSGGTLAARKFLAPADPAGAMGTLAVQTNPPGASVVIDGKQRGGTPLSIALTPGRHVLELVTEGDVRSIPIDITPGGQVSQMIEL